MKFKNESILCRFCNHNLQLLPVAQSPVAGYKCDTLEESLAAETFALDFLFCPNCSFLQYKNIPGAQGILDKLYKEHQSTYYLTGTLSAYLDNFVKKLTARYTLSDSSHVLEIGCNDGYLLSLFKEHSGCRVSGVEPSKGFMPSWKKKGIQVINDYFNEAVVKKIEHEPVDLIIIRHVLEHAQDLLLFLENTAKLVFRGTTVIVEVPYLQTVLQNKRIDNIGYSHLNYFSIRSMEEIIGRFDMGIAFHELVDTDGGSIVFHLKRGIAADKKIFDYICTAEIMEFLNSIKEIQKWIRERTREYSKANLTGYGAGAKGSHLIYILGLHEILDTVVDDTPSYWGKYIPGTGIQVKSPAHLQENSIKCVLNLAPTHPRAIREKIPSGLDFIDIFER